MAGGSLAPRNVRLACGVRLSYVEVGDSAGPVLVLLPGPTDSWRSYAPVLTHLPRSLRAVAVSQRGHGDSDKPAHGYRIEDFASDAVELLDALGIGRAVLAGHSGSCLTVRRVAADRPDRVAGIVLEAAPSTLRDDPDLRRFVTSFVDGLTDPIDPEVARAFVIDTSSAAVPPELLDELVTELLQVPARVWHQMFAALLDHDGLADLARITAPALLVWGDADPLIDRAAQQHLLDCLRGADLRTFPGAGHTPRWEEPARFAADVSAFVTRVMTG